MNVAASGVQAGIGEIVARQREFFSTGRTIDVGFRIESLRRLP